MHCKFIIYGLETILGDVTSSTEIERFLNCYFRRVLSQHYGNFGS